MIALRAISSFIQPPVFEITRRLRTLPPAAGSSNCKTVVPRLRVSLFAFANRYQGGPSCCSSSCLYSSSVVGERLGPLPALCGVIWQEANPSHKRKLTDKTNFVPRQRHEGRNIVRLHIRARRSGQLFVAPCFTRPLIFRRMFRFRVSPFAALAGLLIVFTSCERHHVGELPHLQKEHLHPLEEAAAEPGHAVPKPPVSSPTPANFFPKQQP